MIDRHKFVRGMLERTLDEGCELIRAEDRPKFRGDNLLHVEANGRKRQRFTWMHPPSRLC
jgi:hypothetical protein